MPGTARGFIVFDLVDDKIVFETSYAKPYVDDSHNKQTEEEWFEQSRTKVKDYGIIFSQDSYAGDVPFTDDKSDAVFCPLIVKNGKIMQDKLVEPAPMGGEGLSGSKIVMLKITGSGESAKIQGKIIVETFNASITEKAGFINIYKSPFEDRLAVLVETYSWGFEGSEERGIFFIGCHMKYGFTSDAAYKSLYDKWLSIDYSK